MQKLGILLLKYLFFPLVVLVIGTLIGRFLEKKRRTKASVQQEKIIRELFKRNEKLSRENEILKQEIKRYSPASTGFREFITHQVNTFHEALLSNSFSFKEIEGSIGAAIKQTLAAICNVTSVVFDRDLSHFSCTVMLVDKKTQKLCITDSHNPQDRQYPITYRKPVYEYGKSCAGYAWKLWNEQQERFYVLSDVPKHASRYPKGHMERKFQVIYPNQVEKHKSIISVVLHHVFEEDKRMLGILNIVSNIETLFTREEYKEKLELPLLPYYQTLVFCYLINKIKEKYLSSS